ncbi:hypothetical protein BX281_0283 [Streptomyces sp. Ag82_O1-15]|jgi:hypothetical protein|uniref:hypothetical protein n=1 Tax=Streptomyces sp. Ag82_O1-15 TaxID=1938855 RepID=UPI000BCB6AA6|nr:hypothetical protein [Streptomyces sp. Ag82_O1-15]PBC92604.1 hypothetical protein BX281_0283 [Streptomyces sp. Ag82_O1-15]
MPQTRGPGTPSPQLFEQGVPGPAQPAGPRAPDGDEHGDATASSAPAPSAITADAHHGRHGPTTTPLTRRRR